jgi:hypothetical protein
MEFRSSDKGVEIDVIHLDLENEMTELSRKSVSYGASGDMKAWISASLKHFMQS